MVARKPNLINLLVILALILPGGAQPTAPPTPSSPSVAPAPAKTAPALKPDFGQLPLYFVENRGQLDERVAYYIQGSDKTLYFTSDGVTFALTRPSSGESTRNPKSTIGHRRASDDAHARPLTHSHSPTLPYSRWAVKLDFVGANPNVRPIGQSQTEAVFSYFKGKPDEWHTGLRTYSRIVYPNLWPGIDLVYYGTANQLKYEFVVRPGADPNQIRLTYRGATDVRLNPAGQLEVTTPQGNFTDDTPVAYQDIDGQRVPVSMAYALDEQWPLDFQNHQSAINNPKSYGFRVGDYDPTRPLVLDPAVLVYAGYIGGVNGDIGFGIVVDGAGNAYVTGETASSEVTFPVTVGPDLTHNGVITDAFVAKVNVAGTGLVYAGYIGGDGPDYGTGIVVDEAGNAYVTGQTDSTQATFPVTVGPDLTYNGYYDAFVAKVNVAGTGLTYAGYIGGASEDKGFGIAVDGAGNAYVTGETASSEVTFPVTVGPDLTFNSIGDAFVAKVNVAGTGLTYAGYIGGDNWDYGTGIAVDEMGNAYVTGDTRSTQATFPVTIGPDLTYNGGAYGGDAFVGKVNTAGTGLVYAGYIGGDGDDDQGLDIVVDGAGNAYVIGKTDSTPATFPVTVGPDLTYNGGGSDAFVAKVNPAGTGLIYAGYIGGDNWDYGTGIAVDEVGNAYVTGLTNSADATFPVTIGPDLTFNGDFDAFVAKVNTAGAGLVYAGYIGGADYDDATGIAVDRAGNAYVMGWTQSAQATFPVTVGPDLTHNGYSDAFVAKVGGVPSSFLDLPIDYSNSNFAQAARGNVDGKGPGRVNSWFDHTLPNYSKNNNLTRYDGRLFSPATRKGESWYDGHNGIDFKSSAGNEQAFAAAPGTVLNTSPNILKTDCKEGFRKCGNGYGNQVWIDHGNGYATLYAHLQTNQVFVTADTQITTPSSQPLGLIGNTGNSNGPHLHFGVYYDQNGNGQWTSNEVIDPYGWEGSGQDPCSVTNPYKCLPGRYLWKYSNKIDQVMGASGASLTSPSNSTNVNVPPGALASDVTLELWDTPPAAVPSAQLRSTGYSFWLRVLEWLTGSSVEVDVSAASSSFAQPITLTVTYGDAQILHLNENLLTIYRRNESNNSWVALPTTVDANLNQASAQTTEIGSFDLQGPLLCPADTLEPNDNYYAATILQTNGTVVNHLFDIAQDEDWLQIETVAGRNYTLQTSKLAAGVDTVLELYNLDGSTLLASNDNDGGGLASRLEWQAPMDGTYFVRVSRAGSGVYGCNATYSITASFTVPVNTPSLLSPTPDILTTNYMPALDWGDVTPAPDHYEIQVDDDDDFSSPVIVQTTTQSDFTPATPIDPNTKYYWRVRAFNAAGQFSPWSATRSFRTALLSPVSSFPGGLSQPASLRPLFDWGNVSGTSSYNLQISTNQNFTTLVLNMNVSASAYTPMVDLPKGALLFWRVRTLGTNGPSAWSRVRHFDSPNPPSVPALLTPAHNATVANGQPTLDWSDSSPGVDHYEVQISTSEIFANVLGRGRGGRTAVSQYTPEAALGAGAYYWRVRAVNAQGQFSQWSAARSFNVP